MEKNEIAKKISKEFSTLFDVSRKNLPKSDERIKFPDQFLRNASYYKIEYGHLVTHKQLNNMAHIIRTIEFFDFLINHFIILYNLFGMLSKHQIILYSQIFEHIVIRLCGHNKIDISDKYSKNLKNVKKYIPDIYDDLDYIRNKRNKIHLKLSEENDAFNITRGDVKKAKKILDQFKSKKELFE